MIGHQYSRDDNTSCIVSQNEMFLKVRTPEPGFPLTGSKNLPATPVTQRLSPTRNVSPADYNEFF